MDTSLGYSPRGSFALVSYLPDPLGAHFEAFRQTLVIQKLSRAHLTVLPPRPLHGSVESVHRQIESVLGSFPSFEVELSCVRHFPDTGFLYVDIADGSQALHDLHAALNCGQLAFAENFTYRPHVTLGGPVPRETIDVVQQEADRAWNSTGGRRRLVIDELVSLRLPPRLGPRHWNRLRSFKFGSPTPPY